jgi:hypothetical protein
LVGGYEFRVVFFAGDLRGEGRDGFIAERAVYVEMEFYFGELGHVQDYRA